MLTTLPRAAPRAARRLTTGAATRAPLAPPYEHAVRSSLAPPYAQHVPAATDPLQPAYSYQLVQRRAPAQPAPTPAEWVAAVLETEAGRTWAQSAWSEAIAELAEQPSTPPEIPFQALRAVLADSGMHSVLQRAGSVVVRDVVRDALASAWAAELLAARAQRSHATFHHEAQVAARADASVLSATSQVAAALTGSRDNYVRIDAASPAPAPSTWTGKSLWEVSESAGASPLRAHLALAPTALGVPTASAAATYALLRPHFAARASRISFYSSADYLAEGNWVLRERGADYDAAHVHVRPARVNLAPGDVLVSHAGLNLASDAGAEAGLVLPVHPLPATKANKAFVARQRAAFEAGLPPPHVAVDGLVALEPAGDAAAIDTYVGRRAMGYDA